MARSNCPVLRHLVEYRKMQVQFDRAAIFADRSPSHAIHCAQHRPVHGSEHLHRLAQSSVAKLSPAFNFIGQFPDYRRQYFRIEKMLSFGKGGRGHSARTDFAHFRQTPTGMAQRAHRSQRGVEQAKEQKTKIILRQQLAPRILFGRCLGRRSQMRPQTLFKLPKQFPTLQLVLSDCYHVIPEIPHRQISYKLHLRDGPVTHPHQTNKSSPAKTLPNTTAIYVE